MAGMILENKFERYLEMNVQTDGWKKFLQNMLLPSLRAIPRQKIPISLYFRNLFPAKTPFGNQHCFCDLSVQPGRLLYPATEKRIFHELQMQFSFFLAWPEGEELSLVTGLKSAAFCHKGGFLMTCGTLEDSVLACRSSLAVFHEEAVIVSLGGNKENRHAASKASGSFFCQDRTSAGSPITGADSERNLRRTLHGKDRMEKLYKDRIKEILRYKPEAVFADNAMFSCIPSFMLCEKTYSRSYSSRKRRTEASGTDPIRFLKILNM